jgi:hypothetical protein
VQFMLVSSSFFQSDKLIFTDMSLCHIQPKLFNS